MTPACKLLIGDFDPKIVLDTRLIKSELPLGEVYAKVGTMPALVIFDRRGVFEIGRKIRFKDHIHGSKWETGILDNLDPIRISRQ